MGSGGEPFRQLIFIASSTFTLAAPKHDLVTPKMNQDAMNNNDGDVREVYANFDIDES